MTGMQLKLMRIERRVRATDLATAMGLKNHSRVSQIESAAVVTENATAKYLAALATFPVVDSEQRRDR
jgi:transcriptional regulator with XRE-family HTH domain